MFAKTERKEAPKTLSIILFISRGERRSRHMMDIGREYIGIKQSHGSHQTEYRRNHSVPDLHVRDITPSLILHHREKKYFSRSRIIRIYIWLFDVGYCNGESQGKPDSENNFHFSLKLSHFSRGRLGISL